MKSIFFFSFLLLSCGAFAQYAYEPSAENPYGLPNPDAPSAINDWDDLIGTCTCKSVARVSQTEWADTVAMTWQWKYIMNGWAVQDETLKADGGHSGSIRQYNADSSRWYVHYYSNGSSVPVLPA